MKNERASSPNEPVEKSAPRKLHKPLRANGDLRPEQVVTYGCEDDTEVGTYTGG